MCQEIRALTVDDAETIFALEQICFPVDGWRIQTIRLTLNDPFAYWYGMFSDDVLLGCAQIWGVPDTCDLMHLCVSPAFRRQGVAKCLLRHVCTEATAAGHKEMLLEVRPSNASAVTLYRAFGFEHIYTRKNYYSRPPVEDALILRLQLDAFGQLN